MIENLFKQLAGYYRLENDLSNITCILCETSPFFREKFVHYFFPALKMEDIAEIKREVPDTGNNGSRVDFAIRLKNDPKPYLIEVKIYDENHHFGQYERAYQVDKSRLGYIANYNCAEGTAKGYDVKQWNDFYDYISEVKTVLPAGVESDLVSGYLLYLQKVCGLVKFDAPVQLDVNSASGDLKMAFDSALQTKTDKWELKTYNYPDSGIVCFYVTFDKNPSVKHFGFVTLPQCKNGPGVAICFQNSCFVAKVISANEKLFEDGEYCRMLVNRKMYSSNCICAVLDNEKIADFSQMQTFAEQKNLLENFVKEIIDKIEKII